jgi:hypothetical protein
MTVWQGNILVDVPNYCFVVLDLLESKYCRIDCLVRTTSPRTLPFELQLYLDHRAAV